MPRYRSRSAYASGVSSGLGARLKRIMVTALLVVVIGGLLFLGIWDIPPPSTTVERVIPHERFAR